MLDVVAVIHFTELSPDAILAEVIEIFAHVIADEDGKSKEDCQEEHRQDGIDVGELCIVIEVHDTQRDQTADQPDDMTFDYKPHRDAPVDLIVEPLFGLSAAFEALAERRDEVKDVEEGQQEAEYTKRTEVDDQYANFKTHTLEKVVDWVNFFRIDLAVANKKFFILIVSVLNSIIIVFISFL